MKSCRFLSVIAAALVLPFVCSAAFAQDQEQKPKQNQRVRTVTIPISIFTKKELKQDQAEEFIQADRLIVKEDKDEQTILSIRSVANTPLTLAVLIQDDLSSNFNLQIQQLKRFITALPRGSRVMVAYVRGGSLQVTQRFTDNLEKASHQIRIVTSSAAAAPRNPYDGVIDALDRFDALPYGRRAIILISDGLDASQGLGGISPSQSLDLDRAILRAQRKSVAVYTIYSPASLTENGTGNLVLVAQGGLQRLSDETGGSAFFQGSIAPVSFDPFFKDLSIMLNRQFALTYLSTHMKKGYHKVDVTSTNPAIKIEHPKGYYAR